jgi:tyrosine-protein kinase Etk/Wzc
MSVAEERASAVEGAATVADSPRLAGGSGRVVPGAGAADAEVASRRPPVDASVYSSVESAVESAESSRQSSMESPVPPVEAADMSVDEAIDFEAAALELWRRRRTILQASAAALLVSVAVALLLPPYYTATVSFLPPSTGGGVSAGLAASLSALGASGLMGGGKSSGELYVGILKSRTVLGRMVDRFDLMKVYGRRKKSRAESELEKATVIETDLKNPIVSIRVSDFSAGRARDMANAYLDELRAASGGLAVTESSQRRLFYEQRLAREKDDLANAEVALKQAQEATGLIAPSGQMSAQIEAIAGVRAEIAGRLVQLASLQQGATDQNAELIRLKAEIAGLRSHLGEMEHGEQARPMGDISASRVPGLELEYIRKAREVKYHEALFEIIARQYEAARLDEANNPPVLQVLDEAVLPDARAGPPRTVIAAAGLFLGLLGSSLWVWFQAARRRLGEGPAG